MKHILFKCYLILSLLLFAFALHAQPYDIIWENGAGVSVSGNSLTKTATTAWGNSGAGSTQILTANTDGWVEVTAVETDTYRMFGFSSSNPDNNYASINYGIVISVSGGLLVFENGTNMGNIGTYSNGDRIRVERTGTTILYKRNGSTVYTSSIPSSSQLVADASLFSIGATIANAKYCFGSGSISTCPNGGTPQAVGTACDDGDSATTGETIQADGCTCGGGMTTPPSSGSSFFVIDDANSTDNAIRYSGGKVIIGDAGLTKAGDYKLYVDGGLLTELAKVSIRSSSNWSDYVFDQNYDLKEIEEVASFIKENKHLPNVPSAKEVVKEGINVAEMDATLLRQIEELWLHLIELKKENELLKVRISKLEK